jgi:hypothetical protein
MSIPVPTNRPKKRRRTDRICEGDAGTADAFIVDTQVQETEEGPVRHITRTPVWTNRPHTAANDAAGSDAPEICGMNDEGSPMKRSRVSQKSKSFTTLES